MLKSSPIFDIEKSIERMQIGWSQKALQESGCSDTEFCKRYLYEAYKFMERAVIKAKET